MQIALGGAGEDSDNDLTSILFFARLLQGGPGHGPAADTDREALFLHDLNGGGNGIVVRYRDNMVDEVDAQGIGQEARAQSLDAMRPRPSAGKHGAGSRFDGDHFQRWLVGAQPLGDARERTPVPTPITTISTAPPVSSQISSAVVSR